jgi:hypothetical protein
MGKVERLTADHGISNRDLVNVAPFRFSEKGAD